MADLLAIRLSGPPVPAFKWRPLLVVLGSFDTVVAYFVLPEDLALLSQIAITARTVSVSYPELIRRVVLRAHEVPRAATPR